MTNGEKDDENEEGKRKKKKEWRKVIYPMRGLLRCSSQRKNNKNTTYTTYNPKYRLIRINFSYIIQIYPFLPV